jgi:23S rRNA pseudoU1915 N3-methylase RlmH
LSLEDLKNVIISSLRNKSYTIIIDNKPYTCEQLIKEVENGTDVGKKLIEIVIGGTIERYSRGLK